MKSCFLIGSFFYSANYKMESSAQLNVTESGARLDRYISDHMPELSRAAVQRLIEDGHILVDNIARKASYRLQAGEMLSVRIPPPEPATPRAEQISLDILFENDDLIVVNKPAGMVVHPAAGHSDGTLVNAILGHCPTLNVGGVERPGIVHRLDSETSGIIVVAKNDKAMRDLQAQFKSRSVKKTYLALVEGMVRPPNGKIDAPIGRDPKYRQKMAVISNQHGMRTRDAVTVYHKLADLDAYSLLKVEPQTGRTHQIRVHLAFMGFPVVADAVYGKRKNAIGLTRHFLHAWKITFTLPSDGQVVSFVAPLTEDLRVVLAGLGFAESNL
jgi:23S rRNA pseudouridine1911/1915/1917 synthase